MTSTLGTLDTVDTVDTLDIGDIGEPRDTARVGPPGRRPRPPGRARRARGSAAQPAWVRPALLTLLVATGALYLWDLSASGWANSYYAAAVQAATQSWKAWFFGSLDAGNSITVDKPPASLWVMGLSAKVFGFNSWSLLVPQALEGVAAVGLLYATVKRWSGPVAGLLAGAALALTPAAALMFRFDNPDALLTTLLVASAYALTRAMDGAATRTAVRWIALAGTALGFAFLTKMLQGFLVVPAFAVVYLVAAPTTLGRRIRHLAVAAVSMIVSAGWFVAAVELWPAAARPYIGGSTTNSLLELALGYNGLSRITGNSGGGGGNGTAGSSFGGATGLSRLFSSDMGIEVSWLLPAALVATGFAFWTTRRAPRTDRTRAALLMWSGWLGVTGLVFSFMSGTVHPYYTVALAPAVVALVAVGGRELWLRRESVVARAGLAATSLAASGWSFILLARNASWHPELRYAIAVVGVLSALALFAPPRRLGRTVAAGVLSAAVVAGMAGTTSYAVATAATAHTGSIPTVGPAGASSGMGGGPGGMGGGPGGMTRGTGTAPTGGPGQSSTGASTGATGASGTSGTASSTSGTASASSSTATGPSGTAGSSGTSGQPGESTSSTSALVALLQAANTRWAAATMGANSAGSLELASGTSVMGIGGFTGSDPSVTLAQFKAYVAAGEIRYFVVGGQGQGGPGGNSNSEITSWVTSTFTATTVGGSTVYDLSTASTSG